MALDGIVLSNIVSEFKRDFVGGRISRIYQTEKDEIIVSIRSQGKNSQVLLTIMVLQKYYTIGINL